MPSNSHPAGDGLTFADAAAPSRPDSSEWEQRLFQRWSAVIERNAQRLVSNEWGPIVEFSAECSTFGFHDDHTYARIAVSLGRAKGERKDSRHVATDDEIAAFQRVLTDFADDFREAVSMLPFHDEGTSAPGITVSNDTTSRGFSAWAISAEFGNVSPYVEYGEGWADYTGAWNQAFYEFMRAHTVQLADSLMDAGVYVNWQSYNSATRQLRFGSATDSSV